MLTIIEWILKNYNCFPTLLSMRKITFNPPQKEMFYFVFSLMLKCGMQATLLLM